VTFSQLATCPTGRFMSDLRVHLLVDYQLYSFVDLSEPHGTFVPAKYMEMGLFSTGERTWCHCSFKST